MRTFFGKAYLYPTPGHGTQHIGVVGVVVGQRAATWIVAHYTPSGGRRRIVTNALPPMSDPETLQNHLDKWAAKRKLQEVA